MIKFIVDIYEFMKRHGLLRNLSLLLITICLGLLVLKQTYREDISDFLPLSNKYQQALNVYQDISGADRIVTIFQFKDSTQANPDSMIVAISDYEQRLLSLDGLDLSHRLTTRVDDEQFAEVADFVYTNMPYFLTEADYSRIDSLLSDEGYVEKQLAADKQMLMFPVSGLLAENFQRDPLNLFTPVVSRMQSAQPSVKYQLYDGYIFSEDMNRAFAIMPSPFGASETEHNHELLYTLQQKANETMTQYPQIDVRFIGAPIVAVGNANQIKRDSLMSVLLALVLIIVLLYWAFRNMRNISLIAISIAWGWLFAMGLLSVFHDQMSVIVIGISSVVLGIAINYPLHLIAHLRHTPNVKMALKEIAMPLVVGNVTTVGAFLALVPLKSVALRDLGTFAAFLLIGTIVFVLLYLPHLVKAHSEQSKSSLLNRISGFSFENHRWLTVLVIVLTVVLGYFSFNTSFDANMSHINYMTEQQKADMAYFQQMTSTTEASHGVYVVSTDSTMEGAVAQSASHQRKLEALHDKEMVKGYNHIGRFLEPLNIQKERLGRWNRFVEKYAQQLEQGVNDAASKLGFAKGSFNPFFDGLRAPYVVQELDYFDPLIKTICTSHLVIDSANHVVHVVDVIDVDSDKTNLMKKEIEQLMPDALVFDVEGMNSSIATSLSNDFNYIGWACALIVFLFLWYSLGNLELALLSFIPMAISWVWILGIMSLLGIQFNIVNIILATFIFGQGDDYTIFMTEGCQYEYAYGRKMLASYKKSIIISALMMFIGIGSLILAKHPALHSLAQVTIVGMFSVVLMAYLFPPLIFKWLVLHKNHHRHRPFKLLPFLNTVYCGIVFFIQLISVYILGFINLELLPPSESRKRFMRKYIKRCFWFDVNHIPGVKFALENPPSENFSCPAVVICNHQSMLDTAILMALSDNFVIVANYHASRNILVRRIFHWLDFYSIPTTGAMDENYLINKMQSGYCVAIFPEGERNDQSSIKRFHKGAFSLAEKGGVDIIPLYLHGVNHVFPRYSVCTYPGEVTVVVGDRIHNDDLKWGGDYIERTKTVHQLYLTEYERFRRSKETFSYFTGFVLDHYRYRGKEIYTTVQKRIRRNQCYRHWARESVSLTGAVVINCGWGEFPIMLSLVNPQITILALDDDQDKLYVATHCIADVNNKFQAVMKSDSLSLEKFSESHSDTRVYLIEPSQEDLLKYELFNPLIIR